MYPSSRPTTTSSSSQFLLSFFCRTGCLSVSSLKHHHFRGFQRPSCSPSLDLCDETSHKSHLSRSLDPLPPAHKQKSFADSFLRLLANEQTTCHRRATAIDIFRFHRSRDLHHESHCVRTGCVGVAVWIRIRFEAAEKCNCTGRDGEKFPLL